MAATDYDFVLTRTQIITRALSILGAYTEGDVLSAYQEEQGQIALNEIVKRWQTKHTFLWTEKIYTTPTVASDDDYALPTDPPFVSVDKVYIVDDDRDHLLEQKSFRDFMDIYDKTNKGFPDFWCIDHDTFAAPVLRLWPVPNEIWSIKMFGIIKLKDFDTASSTPNFPSRWQAALTYALAYDLSFQYPVPMGEKQAIKVERDETFLEAKNTDSNQSSDYRAPDGCFPQR